MTDIPVITRHSRRRWFGHSSWIGDAITLEGGDEVTSVEDDDDVELDARDVIIVVSGDVIIEDIIDVIIVGGFRLGGLGGGRTTCVGAMLLSEILQRRSCNIFLWSSKLKVCNLRIRKL